MQHDDMYGTLLKKQILDNERRADELLKSNNKFGQIEQEKTQKMADMEKGRVQVKPKTRTILTKLNT